MSLEQDVAAAHGAVEALEQARGPLPRRPAVHRDDGPHDDPGAPAGTTP